MALIYYGMAILAIIGAGAIVAWVRRSDEGFTVGIVVMVATLLIAGILMIGLGLFAG